MSDLLLAAMILGGFICFILIGLVCYDIYTYWYEEKSANSRRKKYRRGFNWVMEEYFIDGGNLEEIEYQIACAYDPDEFEDGAARAIKIVNLYHEHVLIPMRGED